jgi:hypothetical protein
MLKFAGSEAAVLGCIPEDLDERIDGTSWVMHAANHTAKGHSGSGGVYLWLHDDGTSDPPPIGAQADPPPIGTHTFTGPDGLVIDQKLFRIRPCTAACCGATAASNGYWYPAETGDFFLVVTALFSR